MRQISAKLTELEVNLEGQAAEPGAVLRNLTAVAYAIPRGSAGAYYPEANVLVPVGSVAEKSNTPTSKSVMVTISPSPDVEIVSRTLFIEAAEVINAPLPAALSEGA